MKKTAATRFLDKHGVTYSMHEYAYQARGGTRASSAALRVDEHQVIKTLVFEDEKARPLLALMHGDQLVSAKALSRAAGVKRVRPCEPAVAHRHTGYQVGGTSPFGTRKTLKVYVQTSILALQCIYINGGGRGLLVSLDPVVLPRLLDTTSVEMSRER